MQTWDADLLARVDIRLGERKSNTIYSAELVKHGFVLCCPLAVDRLPFLDGKLVDGRGDAVVFTSANEVLGKVATRNIPVCTHLLEIAEVANHRVVRLGHDGEVGVAEFVGPFVVGVREDEGRYVA